jgi:hypothetical protein
MDTTTILINVLTKSIKKNGEGHVLTLGHLLNIVELIAEIEENQAMNDDIYPYDSNWD